MCALIVILLEIQNYDFLRISPNFSYSNSTTIEDKSSDLTNLRPRARTDASTLLGNSNSTSTITLESSQDHTDAPNSPKNLKKLTAAIRANINNNVARVNRPLSTRGLDNEGLVTTTTAGSNHDHHHNSSPPMNSGKKRQTHHL